MATYEVRWKLEGVKTVEDVDSPDEAEEYACEQLYEDGGSWARYNAEVLEVKRVS